MLYPEPMETEYHIIEVRRPKRVSHTGRPSSNITTTGEAFRWKTIISAIVYAIPLALMIASLAGKCRWNYPQDTEVVDDPSVFDDDPPAYLDQPYITLWKWCWVTQEESYDVRRKTKCCSLDKEPSWSEYASEIKGQRFLVIFGLIIYLALLIDGYVSSYEEKCPISYRLPITIPLWTLAYITMGLIFKLNSMISAKSPYSNFTDACHGTWIAAMSIPVPFVLFHCIVAIAALAR